MNTYKITFTRKNGTVGTDTFIAATGAQARRDFHEVYRHGIEDITNVELVSTDTPATKQQERDALEEIRKIVERLGPDSYVATAFQGCFEIAAENIANDWSCSMAERARLAEKRAREAEEKLAESEKDYQAAHETAHIIAEEKDAEIAKLKARIQELLKDSEHGREYIGTLSARAREAQRRAEAAEAETVRLKAKPYDMMTN